jgi:hypothetical protein
VNHIAKPIRDCDQHLVAHVVAEYVVDFLEMAQVDPDHRRASLADSKGVVQALAEHDAIGQAGERVVHGSISQLGLKALLLAKQSLQPSFRDRLV